MSGLPDMCRGTRTRGAAVTAMTAVTAVIAVCATAGCGAAGSAPTAPTHSTSPTSSTSSTPTTRRRAGKPAPRARARRRTPRVGTTQRVKAGASTLSVTVTKVIDPLRDSGASLLPGTRAVGVVLTIRDDSGATYDSTASGDVSVLASSGPAAPLFIKQGICETPLADFESLIGVGTVHDGCVGFALPRSTRIMTVRFSPHSRQPGTVSWR
jgi:hypothetical protein